MSGVMSACVLCASSITASTTTGQLQTTEVRASVDMIGVDFMGSLPLSRARNSILKVAVDYCSNWVELFALKDGKMPKLYPLCRRIPPGLGSMVA